MSDLDVLHELVNGKALVQFDETPHGNKTVILSESGNQGKIQYSIKIKEVPNNTVVVKADKFPPPDQIFTGLPQNLWVEDKE